MFFRISCFGLVIIMSTVTKKRDRGANYTPEEKILLIDIIMRYKHVVEDKSTIAHILNKKKEVWKQITSEYNSNCTTGLRQTDQLKVLYDNMKQKSRKNVGESNKIEYIKKEVINVDYEKNVTKDEIFSALKNLKEDKIQINKTESGFWKPDSSENEVNTFAIIHNQVKPLSNPYDSGALYFKDSDNITGNDSMPRIVELEVEPSAAIQDKRLEPVQVDYGDPCETLASPSLSSQTRHKPHLSHTTPSRTPSQKKLKKRDVTTARVNKPKSADALKRLYFKRKCENAALERKRIMNEIFYKKQEHNLKMIILKKELNNCK